MHELFSKMGGAISRGWVGRRALHLLADRRGFVLPTAAVFFIVAMPIVGLVVDVGIDYIVQTKLQLAIDAAALAGARSLSRGNDDATQQTNAQNTARAYLTANFPTGYFGVSTPTITALSIDESVAHVRSLTLTANSTVPLMFLGWFGAGSTKVGATATATRRDVNVMIVMDRSGSLANSGSCAPLKAAATGFVSKFANGTDNVGLITFATSTYPDFPLATNFNTASTPVSSIINNVVCNGATNSAQALWQGYQALATLNQTAALNVMLFFTDGQPTAVTAVMPRASGSSCNSSSYTGVFTVGFQTTSPFSPVATGGLFDYTNHGQPLTNNTDAQIVSTYTGTSNTGDPTNCSFATSWSSNWTSAASDIVGVPTTDIWGNNLNNGYLTVNTATSGGKTYVTVPSNSTGALNMINASTNAADDAGARIRAGASPGNGASALPGITIFSIGLGNSTYPANGTFLERVANDPSSTSFSTTAPTGLYVFAPTSADLSDAFARVAAEILRLAR
jgi:Flp pilus assembly protein TadG